MTVSKKSVSKKKKSGGKKTAQPEERYIDISQTPRDSRAVIVWLVVVVITALVLFVWFLSLSQTIANQARELNLEKIKKDIDTALSGFDTGKNLASSTPLLSPQELTDLKNSVISQIQQNEAELWPVSSSTVLGLAFRLPPTWQTDENQNTLRLADYDFASAIPDNFTLLTITTYNNSGKQSLFSWFSRNKINLKDYSLDDKSLDSSSSDILHYTKTVSTAGEVDRRVYLKTSNKVYEIEIIGQGDEIKINETTDEIINSLEPQKK